MAADHSLALRGAITRTLKQADRVTALVPAERIYAKQPDPEVDWPFARVGPLTSEADEASGQHGASYILLVHGFFMDPVEAHKFSRAAQDALDETSPALTPQEFDTPDKPPAVVELLAEGADVTPDSQRVGGYHATVRLAAVTAEER